MQYLALQWHVLCCQSGVNTSPTLLFAKSIPCSLFAVALMAWSPLQTRADMIALNSTISGAGSSQHNSTKGWAFTISSPVLVTQLGLWDQGNNGLKASHLVTIW